MSLPGEDLARDRPGVFGVDVQLVGLERVEEDLRPAQLAAVQCGMPGVLEQLAAGDLAQDHRFGESLRPDADGRRR